MIYLGAHQNNISLYLETAFIHRFVLLFPSQMKSLPLMFWGNTASFSPFLQILRGNGCGDMERGRKKQEERDSTWRGGDHGGHGPGYRGQTLVVSLSSVHNSPFITGWILLSLTHSPYSSLLWLGSLFQDLRFSCFHLSLQRGRVISQRLVMQERKGGPQTTWVLMTSENFFLRLKEMFQSHKMKWRCLKTQNLRCEHWVPDLGFLGSLNGILQGTQYEALTGQSLIL